MPLIRSVEALTEEFRANGLKVTPPRQVIFRALSRSSAHPHAHFPGVSLPAEGADGFEVTAPEIVFRGHCRDGGTSSHFNPQPNRGDTHAGTQGH